MQGIICLIELEYQKYVPIMFFTCMYDDTMGVPQGTICTCTRPVYLYLDCIMLTLHVNQESVIPVCT